MILSSLLRPRTSGESLFRTPSEMASREYSRSVSRVDGCQEVGSVEPERPAGSSVVAEDGMCSGGRHHSSWINPQITTQL